MKHQTLVVLAVLCACACSKTDVALGGNDDQPQAADYFDPDVPANTIELGNGVYVEPGLHMRPGIEIYDVDPSLNSSVSYDDASGTVVLVGLATKEVEGIEIGDIFVSSETISRVAVVDKTDSGVQLTLEEFVIWDVVHGEWKLELPLNKTGEDRYEIVASDYETRRQLLSQTTELSVTHEEVKATGSITLSADPHFSFEGKIPFYESSSSYHCDNPQIKVDIGCAFGRCAKRYRYCVDYLSMSVTLGAELGASVTMTAKAESDVKFPENARIVSETLGQIPLVGPFTLRSTVFVDRQAYAKAGIKGELKVSATAGATLPLGFEYRNGGGFGLIPNGSNGGSSYGDISGSAAITAYAEAGVWGETGVELGVCTPDLGADICINGLKAAARLTAKGTYEQPLISTERPDHCLSASLSAKAYAEARAEVAVSALGFKKAVSLIPTKLTLTPWDKTIASWDGGGEFCGAPHQQLVDQINAIYDIDIDCAAPDENVFVGTCAETFMKHCFDPQGQCSGRVYEDQSMDMVYSSGERVHNTFVGENPYVMDLEFFGLDQTRCAMGTSTQPTAGCRSETVIELLVDDEEMLENGFKAGDILRSCTQVTTTPGGTSLTHDFTCPDESTFRVGQEDSQICLSGGRCKFEPSYLEDRDDDRAADDAN